MPSNGRDTGFLFFVYDQIVQLFQLLPNILWFFVFLSYIIVFITCKLVLNGFKRLSHYAHNEHKQVSMKKNVIFNGNLFFKTNDPLELRMA